jgi:hypothetical protein
MDRGGVTSSILTVTTPGFWFGDREQTRRLVRASSEYAAALAQRHPGRFGLFAMLPLPDVEGSLREIEYGLDTLGAQGIGLFTNYRDKWIGDPAFGVRRTQPPQGRGARAPTPVLPQHRRYISATHDRPRHRHLARDRARRFSGTALLSDIRYLVARGGPPFIVQRFTREPRQPCSPSVPNGVLHELKPFHSTAQAAHVHAMASLTRLVDASHIVFGTDFVPHLGRSRARLAECGASARRISRDRLSQRRALLGSRHCGCRIVDHRPPFVDFGFQEGREHAGGASCLRPAESQSCRKNAELGIGERRL